MSDVLITAANFPKIWSTERWNFDSTRSGNLSCFKDRKLSLSLSLSNVARNIHHLSVAPRVIYVRSSFSSTPRTPHRRYCTLFNARDKFPNTHVRTRCPQLKGRQRTVHANSRLSSAFVSSKNTLTMKYLPQRVRTPYDFLRSRPDLLETSIVAFAKRALVQGHEPVHTYKHTHTHIRAHEHIRGWKYRVADDD